MKYFIIIALFFFQCVYSQNDIEIKILNDTIHKRSAFDMSNIVFTITNHSTKPYYIVLDKNSLYTYENDMNDVDPHFLGMLDYNIFENDLPVKTEVVMHDENDFFNSENEEFRKFKIKNKNLFKEEADYIIAFRIQKNTILIQPSETQFFELTVNFPRYKQRYYIMENNRNYFFEMSLNNPRNLIDKYFILPIDSPKNAGLFTGEIHSNKIPLVYKVYNNDILNVSN